MECCELRKKEKAPGNEPLLMKMLSKQNVDFLFVCSFVLDYSRRMESWQS